MNDDTIEMAREAGIEEAYSLQHNQVLVQFKNGSLKRFEDLIRADEREACAKVCDEAHELMNSSFQGVASAIRARGETK